MEVVERVLEIGLRRIVTVGEMPVGSMLERGRIDAVFITRSLQELYHAKGKMLCMCFVDKEIYFLQSTVGSVGMFND